MDIALATDQGRERNFELTATRPALLQLNSKCSVDLKSCPFINNNWIPADGLYMTLVDNMIHLTAGS